jgi:hypothetical protein
MATKQEESNQAALNREAIADVECQVSGVGLASSSIDPVFAKETHFFICDGPVACNRCYFCQAQAAKRQVAKNGSSARQTVRPRRLIESSFTQSRTRPPMLIEFRSVHNGFAGGAAQPRDERAPNTKSWESGCLDLGAARGRCVSVVRTIEGNRPWATI